MAAGDEAARRLAVQACARALARDTDVAADAPAGGDLPRLRHTADTSALTRRFPVPVRADSDPLRRLLQQVRAAALGHRDYPGVGANLLAASRHEPAWRGALVRLAWQRITGSTTDPDPWQARLSGGIDAHWLLLRRHLDDPAAFDAALDRLLPLLARRLAAHGVALDPEPVDGTGARAEQADAAAAGDDTTEQQAGDEGEPQEADDEDGIPGAAPPQDSPPGPLTEYRAFTRRYDQEIDARRLLGSSELDALRRRLDDSLAELPPIAHRLAARLQRRLQAHSQRRWTFDREEGLLDASRLAPFVAAPRAGRIFKQEHEAPFNGAAVTLLVDNSGSMKGRRILLAALCTELVVRALERCGVAVEVLGFTTRYWDGGPLREQWRRSGEPAQPGRLNGVRHIVYKAATTPWRRARTALPAMLHEPLLKENVDGEALLWAHARLLRRPEAHRVLMVLSDGAPLDEATAAANGRPYLERHLFDVVEWIERRSPVQLLAIGIGHDVGRYYRRAVTVGAPEALAEVLIEQVAAAILPEGA